MMKFDYREALKKIPVNPGVYQYWDEAGELIYIGKAKNLKNRVSGCVISGFIIIKPNII